MTLDLTTPALLFPAISLLLLAYTSRFLALAALIRKLHDEYKKQGSQFLLDQIANLSRRVRLIRLMQELGVISLLLCVAAMFLLFAEYEAAGKVVFGVSLVTLLCSLAVSVHEVHISIEALNIQLGDLEKTSKRKL